MVGGSIPSYATNKNTLRGSSVVEHVNTLLWIFSVFMIPWPSGCRHYTFNVVNVSSNLTGITYCGIEQLVALRAHNPKALKRFTLVRFQLPLQSLSLINSAPERFETLGFGYGVRCTVERSTWYDHGKGKQD